MFQSPSKKKKKTKKKNGKVMIKVKFSGCVQLISTFISETKRKLNFLDFPFFL